MIINNKEKTEERFFITIEKGYGKELVAFRKYRIMTANEEDKKIIINNYLSVDEIKNYTLKYGPN